MICVQTDQSFFNIRIIQSAADRIRTTFRVQCASRVRVHNCSSRRLHVTSQEGTLRRHLKLQSTVASVSTYGVTQASLRKIQMAASLRPGGNE